jgi:secreted trypsin-like serine protease
LKDLTFEQFRQQFPEKTRCYTGPDLAIVKLDKALPVKLFPEILSKDIKVEASYGYTLGFSHIRTCHPQKPVQLMEYGQKGFRKHLITSKVSSFNDSSACVLYGNYCGRLVDGAEAFLPNDKMMKTEGVPYQGDSGAPFFVKVDGKDYLTGIFASINCCNSQVLPEKEQRHRIEGFIQPIFPTWIDIRHYQDWIREHMGKKK